jgi:hypothetical protein
LLLEGSGLRYKEHAIDPGAQTERRGEAGPVRDLLGGETSPAAWFVQQFNIRLTGDSAPQS